MSKSFFYKVTYNDLKYYDASHMMTPEKRWIRIQNDFFYKPQTLPTLLRSIFEEAKKNNECPKFSVVKEAVATVEPKVRVKKDPVIKIKKEPVVKPIKIKKERVILIDEQKRENRIKYDEQNADKIREKRKEHYDANKKKLLLDKQIYYKKNAEKIIQQKRQYRLDNKEKISLKKKEYYQKKKLEKEISNKIETDSDSLFISN